MSEFLKIPLKSMKIRILRMGHGYYDGGVEKDLCPVITISSWQFNNFLVEVYED